MIFLDIKYQHHEWTHPFIPARFQFWKSWCFCADLFIQHSFLSRAQNIHVLKCKLETWEVALMVCQLIFIGGTEILECYILATSCAPFTPIPAFVCVRTHARTHTRTHLKVSSRWAVITSWGSWDKVSETREINDEICSWINYQIRNHLSALWFSLCHPILHG